MATELKDAMASAVLKEVLENPDKYPQAIACTDLGIPDEQYEDFDFDALKNNKADEKAKTLGLSVVYPAEDELQIDIDNDQSYLFFRKYRGMVNRLVGIASVAVKPSKGGLPKRHITVKLKKPVTVLERICLQACLGSDRVREVLGYVRYKNNDPSPTLFFEKKEE